MAYVVFALRLILGGLLIVAGVMKAHDGPALTATTIAGYRILPPSLVAPLGVALPYVEVLLGGYLLAGFLTRIAGWIAAAQFAVFSAAVASLVIRNIPADCGCFGSGIPTPPSWGHVAVDVALACCAGVVALRAPGAWALDARLATSGSFEPQGEG
ncbi:MAG: DoxX family membrane protein [Candidatus Eremiobacteraeota bacterium]|nr:DoxX family membrane protein [Candidatus Eremiobacteraeota bacterium]